MATQSVSYPLDSSRVIATTGMVMAIFGFAGGLLVLFLPIACTVVGSILFMMLVGIFLIGAVLLVIGRFMSRRSQFNT